MLKYGNRFCIPYEPIRHNYSYMQNGRLSTILQRYRWRARSPIYRPRIIIGLIWCAIILTLVYHAL
jgi:hypothetical protein